MLLRTFFTPLRLVIYGVIGLFGWYAFKPEEEEAVVGDAVSTKPALGGPPPGGYDVSMKGCDAAFATLPAVNQQEISDTIYDAQTSGDLSLLDKLADKYDKSTYFHVGACIREAKRQLEAVTPGDDASDVDPEPAVAAFDPLSPLFDKPALPTDDTGGWAAPDKEADYAEPASGSASWPEINKMPEPHRSAAMSAIDGVVYGAAMGMGGPVCYAAGECSSTVVQRVIQELRDAHGFIPNKLGAIAELQKAQAILEANSR